MWRIGKTLERLYHDSIRQVFGYKRVRRIRAGEVVLPLRTPSRDGLTSISH